MFTIRHVEEDGYESLVEAKKLWRDQGGGPGVFADVGNEHPDHFCTGTVYVMNTAGKTVAVYTLPSSS